jgi:hypothetical protein
MTSGAGHPGFSYKKSKGTNKTSEGSKRQLNSTAKYRAKARSHHYHHPKNQPLQ